MVVQAPRAVRFNQRTGTYSDVDGNAFASAAMRVRVMEEHRALEQRLLNVADDLIANRISLADSERQIAELIKPSVIRMTVLGAGGQKNITASRFKSRYYGAAGAQLRRRYASSALLARQISNGELTEAQIRDRFKRFSRSAYTAFDRADLLQRQTERGHNEGRRSLSPGVAHCPSCPGHETNGFVPIEQIVPRGHACVCGGYCRCNIATRFNSARPFLELFGNGLTERVATAASNQADLDDGPSLADVEDLFLNGFDPRTERAKGFG